jgi:hypothetical protein
MEKYIIDGMPRNRGDRFDIDADSGIHTCGSDRVARCPAETERASVVGNPLAENQRPTVIAASAVLAPTPDAERLLLHIESTTRNPAEKLVRRRRASVGEQKHRTIEHHFPHELIFVQPVTQREPS